MEPPSSRIRLFPDGSESGELAVDQEGEPNIRQEGSGSRRGVWATCHGTADQRRDQGLAKAEGDGGSADCAQPRDE
eukprot:8106093-Pyramimonas_sp.AAC.1